MSERNFKKSSKPAPNLPPREPSSPPTPPRLFQRFLIEAKDVPPSRLTELPIIQEIRNAQPDLQIQVLEDCARAFPNGGPVPRTVMGKYADIAMRDITIPLLRDGGLPFSFEQAKGLLSASRVLPESGLKKVFERLAAEGGWSDELRDVVLSSSALSDLHATAFDPLPRAGEAWTDRALADLRATESGETAWYDLFAFVSRNPAPFILESSWRYEAQGHCREIPKRLRGALIGKWLSAIAVPANATSANPNGLSVRAAHNASLLHGLVATLDERSLSTAEVDGLAHATRMAFSPYAQLGAYLPRLGYRCLRTLRQRPRVLRELAASVGFPRVASYISRL